MRILLADRGLTNGYTIGLAAGLRSSGAKVWIGGPAKSDERSVIPLYPRTGMPGQRVRKACDMAVGISFFMPLLAIKRPDLFHVQWPTALNVAYAFTAKRFYGMRVVYTVHNPASRAFDPDPHAAEQERLIDLADVVLAHGPSMCQLVVDNHPGAAQKTHAVEIGNYENIIHRWPRAEARALLRLPEEGPLFAFVGQLRPRKGVDLLIEAFAEYRERGGIGNLLIAGTATVTEYESRLRTLAERCQSAVHWRVSPRLMPQDTLDLAVSAATQVVLPFQDASQSASLVLAMTHGRCVVSTRVGEVPRTLCDRGILVNPGDRSEIVRALVLAEDEPELCESLGERAREYALTELSWSAIGAKTCQLYQEALSS